MRTEYEQEIKTMESFKQSELWDGAHMRLDLIQTSMI